MWFSYQGDENWIPIAAARVKEIMVMNKAGKKAPNLKEEAIKVATPLVVEKTFDYENVVGQDSLTRLDDRSKNRNSNQNRNPNQKNNPNRNNKNKPAQGEKQASPKPQQGPKPQQAKPQNAQVAKANPSVTDDANAEGTKSPEQNRNRNRNNRKKNNNRRNNNGSENKPTAE